MQVNWAGAGRRWLRGPECPLQEDIGLSFCGLTVRRRVVRKGQAFRERWLTMLPISRRSANPAAVNPGLCAFLVWPAACRYHFSWQRFRLAPLGGGHASGKRMPAVGAA